MITNLTWKKGVLSNTYRIYAGHKEVGELSHKTFKQDASGIFQGKQYRFETQGIFNQTSVIIDSETNIEIGIINYNTWHTKATITIFKKVYQWQYNNIWNTKWSLSANRKLLVNNLGGSTSGKIESSDGDGLLILSSLFVTNYYWQSSIAVLAALIPIYINLFS